MVLPLTCPPVRMVHRGSGAGMDTARYSKAHEDSTLPVSCPSTQRADFLLLQPSRNPEQNHFLFIIPRQTLSRFIGPQVLYLGLSTTRSPRSFLDASWRFKPAGLTLCTLSDRLYILRLYLWAETPTSIHRENVCLSFHRRGEAL